MLLILIFDFLYWLDLIPDFLSIIWNDIALRLLVSWLPSFWWSTWRYTADYIDFFGLMWLFHILWFCMQSVYVWHVPIQKAVFSLGNILANICSCKLLMDVWVEWVKLNLILRNFSSFMRGRSHNCVLSDAVFVITFILYPWKQVLLTTGWFNYRIFFTGTNLRVRLLSTINLFDGLLILQKLNFAIPICIWSRLVTRVTSLMTLLTRCAWLCSRLWHRLPGHSYCYFIMLRLLLISVKLFCVLIITIFTVQHGCACIANIKDISVCLMRGITFQLTQADLMRLNLCLILYNF